MAVPNWLARALARAQLDTFTAGGTWVAGDTATVTINGKAVTFTATTTTATHMITGLLAALQASTIAEFAEVTWTSPTGTTIAGTSATAGVPFTATPSRVTAGTGTFTSVTTTAATGPNHWDDVNNWDTGAVPGNGDTANINLALGSVLYGLAQSAVTLANLNVFSPDFTTNTLGLPKVNAGGYTEYRDRGLAIGATASVLDTGAPLININFGSVQNSTEVRRTGSNTDNGVPAVLLRGTSGSNAIDVQRGSFGLAYYEGESYTAATATFANASQGVCGSGSVLADTVTDGSVIMQGTGTNWQTAGGVADIRGTPGFSVLHADGGTTVAKFGGTIADVVVGGSNGVLDASQDNTPRTFTNTSLDRGGAIIDPNETITYTNGIAKEPGVSELRAA